MIYHGVFYLRLRGAITHPPFSAGDINGPAKKVEEEARKSERKQRPKTRSVLDRDNSRFDCTTTRLYNAHIYNGGECVQQDACKRDYGIHTRFRIDILAAVFARVLRTRREGRDEAEEIILSS